MKKLSYQDTNPEETLVAKTSSPPSYPTNFASFGSGLMPNFGINSNNYNGPGPVTKESIAETERINKDQQGLGKNKRGEQYQRFYFPGIKNSIVFEQETGTALTKAHKEFTDLYPDLIGKINYSGVRDQKKIYDQKMNAWKAGGSKGERPVVAFPDPNTAPHLLGYGVDLLGFSNLSDEQKKNFISIYGKHGFKQLQTAYLDKDNNEQFKDSPLIPRDPNHIQLQRTYSKYKKKI